MSAAQRHVRLITAGTTQLCTELGTWLCGEGSVLTAFPRVAGSACTALFVGSLILGTPGVMGPLSVWWAIAAWRIGRAIEQQEQADMDLVVFIDDLIGDANGMHLAVIVDQLNNPQSGLGDGWTFESLRAAVARLEIPVRDSLKVAGDVSVGVHIDDLTAVWDVHLTTPPPEEQPLPDPVTRENYPTTPTVVRSAEGAQITVTPARTETHRV